VFLMIVHPAHLLVLDLYGTVGSHSAARSPRSSSPGWISSARSSRSAKAIGGGVVRDLLLGAVPPATFGDGLYVAYAT
jgi:hypothetical protein